MAYVPPNSIIKLLADVPIDSSFDHTLWFESVNAQYTYFNSKAVRTFTNVSYTRKGRGYIKVEAPADQLYACNYMMFQNTSYSNKWFYAFCQVEYVNDTTSAVYFTIDSLQTWFFEMQLGQCYVEREHATHDVAGDNLIPEGLETGEYIYGDALYGKIWATYDLLVLTTFSSSKNGVGDWIFTRTQGTYRWGIYTGLNYRLFRDISNPTTVADANSFLTAAVDYFGTEDGVVCLVMVPHDALSDADGYNTPVEEEISVPRITALNGYTPRNKKLLTSPYCFIEVSNCEGQTGVFPQEYFASPLPLFHVNYSLTAAPTATLTPLAYKGIPTVNRNEAMQINNMVQCSYNVDLFKAYLAQSLSYQVATGIVDDVTNIPRVEVNAPEYELTTQQDIYGNDTWALSRNSGWSANVSRSNNGSVKDYVTHDNIGKVGDIVGKAALGAGLVSAATGYGAGAANILGAIYNDLSSLYSKSVAAPHNVGANSGDFLTAIRQKGFRIVHRTIRREFAEILDKYFDRFGYACHQIKIPNIHARTRWSYVKTMGCQVHGNLPADAVNSIQNIFNNGITFWADPVNFGDYSLNNDIILTPVTP